VQTEKTYRPEIDGLRAVAVLAVILYHAHISGFRGGFAGVDVFFVISGYLITRIIDREARLGVFSFARFYERRARRILPALAVMLAASAALALCILLPGDLRQFSQSLTATALFVSNFFFWRSMDYFSQPAELMPLLHSWSLAIEEQFYILFPPLMLLLSRQTPRFAKRAILVLTLGSVAVMVTASASPVASFFLAPMRVWELGLGALLAVGAIPQIGNAGLCQILALLSLAALLASFVWLDAERSFPWPWALLPTIATAILLLACDGASTWAGAALSKPPLVGIGLISYSLYLYHWPLFAFARYVAGPLSGWQTAALLAASLLLAFLSWRFVERPFRGDDALLTRAGAFKGGAAALAILAVGGAAGLAAQGLPQRFPERVQAMDAWLRPDVRKLYRGGSCILSNDQDPGLYDSRRCLSGSGKPVVLLWGDSHAAHLWPGLNRASSFDILQANYSACPPVVDTDVGGMRHYTDRASLQRCSGFNRQIQGLIERQRIDVVILSAHWLLARASDNALDETLKWLRARRIPIILVGPNVEFDTPLPRLLTRQMIYGDGSPVPLQPLLESARTYDTHLRARFGNRDGITYVSILQHLCRGSSCQALLAGDVPVNWDESHLTAQGSQLVAREALLPAIAEILR
jgi:peptidoglycan/LPS O-acetylase OafA/YrhL